MAVKSVDLVPSRRATSSVVVNVVTTIPADATALGIPVATDGAVPRERADLDRATLEASGFGATVGETLVLPRVDGPTVVETGVGTTGRPWPCRDPRRRGGLRPCRRQARSAGRGPDRSRLRRRCAGRRTGRRRGGAPGPLSLPRLRGQGVRGAPDPPDAGHRPRTASARYRPAPSGAGSWPWRSTRPATCATRQART